VVASGRHAWIARPSGPVRLVDRADAPPGVLGPLARRAWDGTAPEVLGAFAAVAATAPDAAVFWDEIAEHGLRVPASWLAHGGWPALWSRAHGHRR
jgi:hypothetical protein